MLCSVAVENFCNKIFYYSLNTGIGALRDGLLVQTDFPLSPGRSIAIDRGLGFID